MKHCYLLFQAILILGLAGCSEGDPKEGNRLGQETSPYLLQHAENPVHWQPWGEDIWERAQKEDKLVLVSIGYSSCHWCHVMEEETFENDSVARFMNQHFISVKVDREERPDVDQVYMTAVQLMTGSGGWPLNVVVLPNGKPVYGGTYHTRERWLQVLSEVEQTYRRQPERLKDYAERVAQGVSEVSFIPEPAGTAGLAPEAMEAAVADWATRWDPVYGGNAGPQKFMLPPNLGFLLSYGHLSGNARALDHVRNTLDHMARGGIYDQIGGGFYRYSTDPRWHIPHFEKMLYDNAQLLSVYAHAYQLFRTPGYREVVERTFGFLQRDLKGKAGGYYAALDADSEGEEGAFYLWEAGELQQVLGDDFQGFAAYYGITPEMAWEGGRYVPYRSVPDMEFARDQDLSVPGLQQMKQGWHERLLEARSGRAFPAADDKIITSWNALLISGLADAYDALEDPLYLKEAVDLYEFIMDRCYEEGRLRHSYKPGDQRFQGFLEDYAFMAQAAFRLYQVSSDTTYLTQAERFLDDIQRFQEPGSPLYRYREDSDLMAPIVKTDDGVMPSPNTVVAGLYFDLGHFFYRPEYLQKSREMVRALQERFLQVPENYAGWGWLLTRQLYPFYEVAIAGPEAARLRGELAREYLPDALVVASGSDSGLPLFEARFDPAMTRIFVCQDHSCRLPVTDVPAALEQLRPKPTLLP